MEVYSIDEAFLDVTGFSNLREHGLAIKRTVWKEQRMPVCVGIAPTKTLAKLANHIAKQAPRLDGVCVIEQIEPWQKLFSKLDVAKVWGVGSKLAKRLHEVGIYSVDDLRRQNPNAIHKRFNITLAKTVRELNGESCLPLELQPPPKQQIFCSQIGRASCR